MASVQQIIFRLNSDRLRRSLLSGFSVSENGILLAKDDTIGRNCIVAHIDSNIPDCPWGRLSMKTATDGDVVITVKAFASNDRIFNSQRGTQDTDAFLLDENIPFKTKEAFFTAANGTQLSGHDDMLLYGQTGRYIWLWFEVDGPGSCEISDIKLYAPGDTFLNTFPEVYKANSDFLRRFLSIFSTLHYDMDQAIENLPKVIDIETAPAEALPVLAEWMGLHLDEGFLTEQELRQLLKVAYPLLTIKGTRRAIEGIVKLFVDAPFYIVERNLLSSSQLKGAEALYGSTPYDFSILINAKSDEGLIAKLQMLVNQFKPVRAKVNIVFLRDCDSLDGFTYLDINGTIGENREGTLDSGYMLNGLAYLGS